MASPIPFATALAVHAATVRSHEVQITAVVTCDCGSHVPFVVPALVVIGRDQPRACPGCGQRYVVQSVAYANRDGDIALDVNIAKHGPPPRQDAGGYSITRPAGEA